MPNRGLAALSVFVLLMAAACGAPLATAVPVVLQAAGSSTMGPLVSDLAAAYHQRDPSVAIEVTAPGTAYGISALRLGETEIAMASWLPPDLDPEWRATAIAREGIAIVVHPENPVTALGLLQLRDLFGGQVDAWGAVTRASTDTRVQPVVREDGSGTRAAFEALVMESQRVTPRAVVQPSVEAMLDYVAHHPAAIGYVAASQVTPAVKVLAVEGEIPKPQSTADGVYPLTIDLWLLTRDPPTPQAQSFVDFVLSAAGQEIVGRGFARMRNP